MTEPTVDPITPKMAEAFANAVLDYHNWHPSQPEPEVRIGGTFFPISAVCDFVDKFIDRLPPHVLSKLYEETRLDIDMVELKKDETYRGGAKHLRWLINSRKDVYSQKLERS
jgi:hypothetical protein